MKLLSADIVKTEKQKGDEELMERSKKLKEAAIAHAKELNEVRAKCDEEKAHLEQNLQEFKDAVALKKASLAQEVATLEARKRDALQPINAQRKDAEKALKAAQQAQAELEEDRSDIDRIRDVLSQERDSVSEREKALVAQDIALKEREAKLAEEWRDFKNNMVREEARIKHEKKLLRELFEKVDKAK